MKAQTATEFVSLNAPHSLRALRHAHTIIVPGQYGNDRPVPAPVLRALQSAVARGARLASICTGAFVLAAAGLLDGKRATTHWMAADELKRLFPKVEVDPDVLYVDNGQILTSAGASAGLDLCLHMVRQDFGPSAAALAAKAAVVHLERPGGQSQFIQHFGPKDYEGSLRELLTWIEQNLATDLSVAALAERESVSIRTLHRRFDEQVGLTPSKWVLNARIRRAQELLETTTLPIEHVAGEAGFGSGTTFRDRFQQHVGVSPSSYRKSFRAL